MRAALLLMLLSATSWAGEAFGVWKLNPARSTLVENQKSVTLRIEPHTRGRGVHFGHDGRGWARVNIQHDPVLRRAVEGFAARLMACRKPSPATAGLGRPAGRPKQESKFGYAYASGCKHNEVSDTHNVNQTPDKGGTL